MSDDLLYYAECQLQNGNFEDANVALLQLAKNGHLRATLKFAENLINGIGIEKNRSEAYRLLENACEMNPGRKAPEEIACFLIKDLSVFSPEVSEDERNKFLTKTFNFHQKALENKSNHIFVLFNLGVFYECGYGTNIDFDQAKKLYRYILQLCSKKRGFKNTVIKTRFRLGRLLLMEPTNLEEGFDHLLYAANNNYLESFVYVGRLYYEVKIVTKDDIKAF